MFEKLYALIRSYNRIIIHRHSFPDGDALGSQIGLKHIILENFPGKEVYVVGDPAGRYAFMEDSVMDKISDDIYRGALAIILDTSAKKLIADDRYPLAAETARVDHHIFCETIAAHEITDTSYESCCGLITEFARECHLRLSPLAAKSLFTGMVTDSGRFRYDSTSARTFALAAFLMENGVDTNDIYLNLYANDYEQMKLKAQYVLKINFTENKVAYIYTTKEELAAAGGDTFGISRGMVGCMADIKGTDIWVNFTETEKGVLCELRSSRFNVNPIAVKYGGGGHAKASGATVKDREEAMRMLDDLNTLAGENK